MQHPSLLSYPPSPPRAPCCLSSTGASGPVTTHSIEWGGNRQGAHGHLTASSFDRTPSSMWSTFLPASSILEADPSVTQIL